MSKKLERPLAQEKVLKGVQYTGPIEDIRGGIAGYVVQRDEKGKIMIRKINAGAGELSERDRLLRAKYAQRAHFVNELLLDPQKKEFFERHARIQGLTPFVLAFRATIEPPVIDKIDLSRFEGSAGDTIRIWTHGIVELQSLEVRILDAVGTRLEEGFAPALGELREYTLKNPIAPRQALTIEVVATNPAGCTAKKSVSHTAGKDPQPEPKLEAPKATIEPFSRPLLQHLSLVWVD